MNLSYLFDPEHWDPSTPGSFPDLLLAHLGYVALALLIGTVIALPVGLYIGHTGRGSFIAINAGNAGRSLPTLGLLMLMVTLLGLGAAARTHSSHGFGHPAHSHVRLFRYADT